MDSQIKENIKILMKSQASALQSDPFKKLKDSQI